MSFGSMASEAMSSMSSMMSSMVPDMIQTTEDQFGLSMVQGVMNIAKTIGNDIEDDSKKQ
ncbi:hypothetical protein PQR05_08820 [Paraburkholderia sediminicola]|uniref:Chlorosome envelope protein B n=1 Tax=Paraburkholderia metrosideri TaxID=580937 RepID=A0ABW9DMV5_9BURK